VNIQSKGCGRKRSCLNLRLLPLISLGRTEEIYDVQEEIRVRHLPIAHRKLCHVSLFVRCVNVLKDQTRQTIRIIFRYFLV
jgi:hypothetical protein